MRYALITGSSGGLGQVFVDTLLEEGFIVFACDIKHSLSNSKNIIPIYMDITDTDSIEKAKKEILKYTNTLDLLINNAGMQYFDSLVECELAKLKQIIQVNFTGAVMVNRIFFDMICPTKGRIIITSSEIGYHQAQPFNSLYSVTKRSIDAYADSLRRELTTIGIKVVKLQLGGFKTPIIDASAASYDAFLKKTKLFPVSLRRLRPFIMFNLKLTKEPISIKKTFKKACFSKHPRSRYRKNNLLILKVLDIFGSKGVDIIFRIFLGKN